MPQSHSEAEKKAAPMLDALHGELCAISEFQAVKKAAESLTTKDFGGDPCH